jgi:hypothetical protein
MEPQSLRDWLAAQGLVLDDQTLRAVEAWRRAWTQEWERVRAFTLRDEDLPAPLWCWPP